MAEKFSITTAIVYVNARPHVGHAYEMITTDTIARYNRLRGRDVFFLTGSDEHSANVLRAAEAQGVTPQAFCDEMVENYYDFFRKLNISNDDFIRTTQDRHKKSCAEFYRRVREAGDIREGEYKGWYCDSCEAFYTDKDLVDGNCPTHHKKPEWLTESNYFFKLSDYAQRLLALYRENPKWIAPESRRNEVVSFVTQGLEDFSTSRASVKWGIPIPDDPDHVIYVWFDALINYLSGLGLPDDMEKFEKYWPVDVHCIGKDIIRFHCVYWPAMLFSAKLPLPKKVMAHGFVMDAEGKKMSKSLGNVVEPLQQVEKYGLDVFRYYLMREAPYGSDMKYSEAALVLRNNSELANDLGNLLSRTVSMVTKYRDGMPSECSSHDSASPLVGRFQSRILKTVEEYRRAMEDYRLQQGLITTWELISAANKFIDDEQPWALKKDPEMADELSAVLAELIHALEVTAQLIAPFMPEKSAEMFAQLNRAEGEVVWEPDGEEIVIRPREEGQVVKSGPGLFPRVELETEEQ